MTLASTVASFDLPNFLTSPSQKPGLLEIKLALDAPLFGYYEGQSVLVNTALKPLNGNLVIFSNEVYRFESSGGDLTIWPGNRKITESEFNSLYVIVREIDHQTPKFDIMLYLNNLV